MTAHGCHGTTGKGEPCRSRPRPGSSFCVMHDPSAEGRERHKAMSQRGGASKAYNVLPVATPMADSLGAVDLGTAEGARQLVSVALARLAALPFSERTAHALAALVSTQRQLIETAELERRIAMLERETTQRHLRAV